MARRSKGLSRPSNPARMKPLSTRGNRSGGVKILSGQDSTAVGRPGGFGFLKSITDTARKASVRRLMVRDPAKGITNEEAAQHIHHNADPRVDAVDGVQSPEILTSLPNPPSSFASGARRTVRNRGVNRSLKKR